jgi:hypothetical protein
MWAERKMKTDKQVKALQAQLEKFFKRHGLHDFAWHEGSELTKEQKARGGEKTYFRMGFDGDLYHVFWPLPDVGAEHLLHNRSLRKTFDGIVEKHGFWVEFEEYYRICFMEIEADEKK